MREREASPIVVSVGVTVTLCTIMVSVDSPASSEFLEEWFTRKTFDIVVLSVVFALKTTTSPSTQVVIAIRVGTAGVLKNPSDRPMDSATIHVNSKRHTTRNFISLYMNRGIRNTTLPHRNCLCRTIVGRIVLVS